MKKLLRRTAIGLGLLAVLLTGVVLYLGSWDPLATQFETEVASVPVPTDAASIKRGEYVARALGICALCHGEDFGGKLMQDHPIYGYVHTPNLTPGKGGVGYYFQDVDWVRAVRYGVKPNGAGIAFMPTDHFYQLSDADLGAMIAFLKQVPPIDNDKAAIRLGLPARALLNSGNKGVMVRALVIDRQAPRLDPANKAEYLLGVGGCDFCHGPVLTGGQGPEPGAPRAPDITRTGRMAQWSFEQFATVMRTGKKPDGSVIFWMHMPYAGYRNLNDEDLHLMFDRLRATSPVVITSH